MKLTSDLIYGFTSSLLLSRYDSPKPIPNFHIELWDLMCLPNRWVAVAAPRGHAKSTAVTHAFVLANALFRNKDFILIVSDTEGQAVQFLGDIKKELYENDSLIKLFGVKRFIKDTESDIIVELDGQYQFRIMAKGSEQKVRGMKWRNKRPNLIVCDDLENDEIVQNEERRDKFRRWFFNALLPCGSDDCVVRVVGTILHLDSLLERFMPQIGDPDTVDEQLKSYSTATKSWLSIRYRAHNEDYSEILWAEKFSKERLTEIREGYMEQGNPEGYAQEYLNYPIDESTAYFQKRDFNPLCEENRDELLTYYSGADLAISERDGRAYTAIVTAGLSSSGVMKVVDVRRFRGDTYRIIDEILSVHQTYKPTLFTIEQENIARSIGPVLNSEMIKRGIFINKNPVQVTQDKIKRARSIQARMRTGSVEFDTKAPWYNDFQQELLQFPKGKYMDQVDAFAHIGLALDKMIPAPTVKELEDMKWDEEFGHQLSIYGQDSITGY